MIISPSNYSVLAEELLKMCDSYSLPIPIITLANSLGFNVYQKKMDPETYGDILLGGKMANQIAKICVNNKLNCLSQKIVIANELARFLLQFNKKTYYHRTRGDINDIEANSSALALEILAPKKLVLSVINKYKRLYGLPLRLSNLAIFLAHDFEISNLMAWNLVQKYYTRGLK